MNLFRSEEHARNWDRYNEAMARTIRPVADWADIFATPYFRERGRPDFLTWTQSDAGRAAFAEVRTRSRW